MPLPEGAHARGWLPDRPPLLLRQPIQLIHQPIDLLIQHGDAALSHFAVAGGGGAGRGTACRALAPQARPSPIPALVFAPDIPYPMNALAAASILSTASATLREYSPPSAPYRNPWISERMLR